MSLLWTDKGEFLIQFLVVVGLKQYIYYIIYDMLWLDYERNTHINVPMYRHPQPHYTYEPK